jgi:hypothetical protein
MSYSKGELKSIGHKAFSVRPFWMGNMPDSMFTYTLLRTEPTPFFAVAFMLHQLRLYHHENLL